MNGDLFAMDIPSALMSVLDSIILGNVLRWKKKKGSRRRLTFQTRSHHAMESAGEDGLFNIQIFSSTWNMGNCASLAGIPLEKWVPQGKQEFATK